MQEVPDNNSFPPVPQSANTGRASNSVDCLIPDEEEPYETARDVDSDEDHPLPPLSEEDRELIKLICLDHDPLVPELSDVRNLVSAYVEGREDELLECHGHGDGEVVEIKKGIVFRDLPILRRWLQEYSVKRKRPFKVRQYYV